MTVAKPRRVGLARVLSKLGFCSRSRALEWIRAGKVKVGGTVRRDPEYPVRLEKDRIEVNDQKIESQGRIYLMLNKPRGAVTTVSDEKGRETVYHSLPEDLPWVAPVGRLDKASEGLLLLTNDPEWSAQILAPETHLAKIYHVQVKGGITEATIASIRAGIKTKGGDLLCAQDVSVIRQGERNSWLEIALTEGKNRHIRRMLAARETEVLRLVRIAIGPLLLGNLAKGACRHLTGEERQAMEQAMQEARFKPR
jgi:23S rRNA pseudouridine2605 synthase